MRLVDNSGGCLLQRVLLAQHWALLPPQLWRTLQWHRRTEGATIVARGEWQHDKGSHVVATAAIVTRGYKGISTPCGS